MPEPVPFLTLLFEAARLSFRRRVHLFFFLAFGLIACLSFFVMKNFDVVLPETSGDVSLLFSWAQEHLATLLPLALFSFSFTLLKALFRGPLFVTLEDTLLLSMPSEKQKGEPALSKRLRRSLLQSLFFEILSLASTLLLFSLLFLPAVLSFVYNQSAFSSIFELSSLLFLAGITLFFFLKEYALLYAVLGGVRPRSALELGYGLFRRNILQSLLFGTLTLGLLFIFTFVLDSAIITSAAFLKRETLTTPFLIFLFSGAFGVFLESLWLLFFHSLAAAKKKSETEKVPSEEGVSETPA